MENKEMNAAFIWKDFIKIAVKEAILEMSDLTKVVVKNAVLEVLMEREGYKGNADEREKTIKKVVDEKSDQVV